MWGWDSTDLIWEATVHIDGPPTGRHTSPLYVLQFPDDFDFAPLQDLFEQRGFSQSDYQGVTIYSHKMDLATDWIIIGKLAIVNTAVIEKDHRLVLSTQLEAIQAVLDAYKGEAQSLVDNSTAKAIAERLGESAGAYIKVGSESCTVVDESPGGRLEKVTQHHK